MPKPNQNKYTSPSVQDMNEPDDTIAASSSAPADCPSSTTSQIPDSLSLPEKRHSLREWASRFGLRSSKSTVELSSSANQGPNPMDTRRSWGWLLSGSLARCTKPTLPSFSSPPSVPAGPTRTASHDTPGQSRISNWCSNLVLDAFQKFRLRPEGLRSRLISFPSRRRRRSFKPHEPPQASEGSAEPPEASEDTVPDATADPASNILNVEEILSSLPGPAPIPRPAGDHDAPEEPVSPFVHRPVEDVPTESQESVPPRAQGVSSQGGPTWKSDLIKWAAAGAAGALTATTLAGVAYGAYCGATRGRSTAPSHSTSAGSRWWSKSPSPPPTKRGWW